AAWKELVGKGPDAILPVLAAFDEDNALTTNWLRPAVDAIAEKADADGKPLPVERLEQFLANTRNAPAARPGAFECVRRADKGRADKLLAGMLQDPSAEIRRDAVAQAMARAAAIPEGEKEKRLAAYKAALAAACDEDQVKDLEK